MGFSKLHTNKTQSNTWPSQWYHVTCLDLWQCLHCLCMCGNLHIYDSHGFLFMDSLHSFLNFYYIYLCVCLCVCMRTYMWGRAQICHRAYVAVIWQFRELILSFHADFWDQTQAFRVSGNTFSWWTIMLGFWQLILLSYPETTNYPSDLFEATSTGHCRRDSGPSSCWHSFDKREV